MNRTTTSRSLRELVRTLRAAHARNSEEWIRRMEVSDSGPRNRL